MSVALTILTPKIFFRAIIDTQLVYFIRKLVMLLFLIREKVVFTLFISKRKKIAAKLVQRSSKIS